MAYKITQRFISRNRSGRPLKAIGTVLHETATPGASDEAEFQYFNSGNRGASAHVFVDYDSITQTIPWNEQAGHAGPTANRNFIGIELCNYNDLNKFNEIWKRAVWLFAYVHVYVIKVTIINSNTLMSHAEVARKWGETDHTDPVGYFAKYGKTVEGFRSEVKALVNSMLGNSEDGQQDDIDDDVLGSDTGTLELQKKLNELKMTDYRGRALAVDGIYGSSTRSAVTRFQSIFGLTVDGIAGAETLRAINAILAKPLLKVGSTGAAVRYVQMRVGDEIDGIYGVSTEKAVKAYQARKYLIPDGIVGPFTWKTLID